MCVTIVLPGEGGQGVGFYGGGGGRVLVLTPGGELLGQDNNDDSDLTDFNNVKLISTEL